MEEGWNGAECSDYQSLLPNSAEAWGAVTPPHSGSRTVALIAVEGVKPKAPAFYNTHE